MLSIWTNIGSEITDFTEKVKDFLIENERNPFLWVGIIIVALIIFELVYNALKDK